MTPWFPPAGLRFVQLPYPMSINRYWTPVGRSLRPTNEGRQWKHVAQQIARYTSGVRQVTAGPVAVEIVLHPRAKIDGDPSALRIDLDNGEKISLDSMQGVMFANDRQITLKLSYVGPPVTGGALSVRSWALPPGFTAFPLGEVFS